MARPQKTLRPTRPNAGTAAWYRRKLEAEVQAMHKSLLWWIEAQYKAGGFAMDAGETDSERLQREMERLRAHWQQHFDSLGERLAKMFAQKVMGYADYNAKTAFQAIGMTVSMTMTDAMQQAYQGVIGEQVGLIRSIAGQHLDNVQRLVMESVSRGRDLHFLSKELRSRYGITKRRAALIARDQNNKATATLQSARQLEMGITHGIWRHSHAGKEPRPSHVKADGEKFNLRKGMFLDGKWTLPGHEINCRCWYSPILPDYLQDAKRPA